MNNTYPIVKDDTLYLYNTREKRIEHTFKNIFEVRNYIEDLINKEHKWWDDEYHMPLHLCMSLEPKDYTETVESYWDNTITIKPERYLVIIDKNYRIFDYSEIYREIIAYKNKRKITYGIGHTYSGNPEMPPKHPPYHYFCHYGYIRHYRGARHLIVNKRERTDSLYVPDNLISDIAETCDLCENDVKRAYRSMRSKRKDFIGDYDFSYADKIWEVKSWKEYKRKAQWKKTHTSIRREAKSERLWNEIMNDYETCLEEYENRKIARYEKYKSKRNIA